MDKETRNMVGVDGCLDDTLGGPGCGGMRSDAEVEQATPASERMTKTWRTRNLAVRTVRSRVLTPHSADQTVKIEVDGRAA